MKEQYKGMMIGGVAGLLLGVLVMMLFGQGELDDVSIGGSETGFKFELKSKKVTTDVLDKIWKDNNFRPVLVDWLVKKEYVSINDDVAIEERLRGLSPKDDLAKKIIAFHKEYVGPFQIIADSARVIKPGYDVPVSRAFTWRGNVLAGKTIELSYPGSGILPIKLKCTGELGAKPGFDSALPNTFHVNESVFDALVGDENKDPKKAAEGWIYVAVVAN
jgi:hypothetical protein